MFWEVVWGSLVIYKQNIWNLKLGFELYSLLAWIKSQSHNISDV